MVMAVMPNDPAMPSMMDDADYPLLSRASLGVQRRKKEAEMNRPQKQ